jgi:hypothetical protein
LTHFLTGSIIILAGKWLYVLYGWFKNKATFQEGRLLFYFNEQMFFRLYEAEKDSPIPYGTGRLRINEHNYD